MHALDVYRVAPRRDAHGFGCDIVDVPGLEVHDRAREGLPVDVEPERRPRILRDARSSPHLDGLGGRSEGYPLPGVIAHDCELETLGSVVVHRAYAVRGLAHAFGLEAAEHESDAHQKHQAEREGERRRAFVQGHSSPLLQSGLDGSWRRLAMSGLETSRTLVRPKGGVETHTCAFREGPPSHLTSLPFLDAPR